MQSVYHRQCLVCHHPGRSRAILHYFKFFHYHFSFCSFHYHFWRRKAEWKELGFGICETHIHTLTSLPLATWPWASFLCTSVSSVQSQDCWQLHKLEHVNIRSSVSTQSWTWTLATAFCKCFIWIYSQPSISTDLKSMDSTNCRPKICFQKIPESSKTRKTCHMPSTTESMKMKWCVGTLSCSLNANIGYMQILHRFI